jgi:hypothetical protein
MAFNFEDLLLKASGNSIDNQLVLEFVSMPASDLVNLLISGSQTLGIHDMGWFILPLLSNRIEKDAQLFHLLLQVMMDNPTREAYFSPVLDMLYKIARKLPAVRNDFYSSLRIILANESLDVQLRVRAARLLAKDNSKSTYRSFETAVQSGHPELIDAVGSVLARWLCKHKTFPVSLYHSLINFANDHPDMASRQPGLLKALAIYSKLYKFDESLSMLKSLCTLVPAEDIDKLIASIGVWVDASILGNIIKEWAKHPTSGGLDSLRGLLVQYPERAQALLECGFEQEFLFCLSIAPNPITRNEFTHIQSLTHHPIPEVAVTAKFLETKQNLIQHSGRPVPVINNFKTFHYTRMSKVGFTTGLNVGDAIYTDLSWYTQFMGQHWHSGLVIGFEPCILSGNFCLRGIHVGGIGGSSGNGVQIFSTEADFTFRTINLTDLLSRMLHDFCSGFCSNVSGFHGSRSVYNLSIEKRKQIVATALALVNTDVSYTWQDQLDYGG